MKPLYQPKQKSLISVLSKRPYTNLDIHLDYGIVPIMPVSCIIADQLMMWIENQIDFAGIVR